MGLLDAIVRDAANPAWVGVVLWITGVGPAVLAELDEVKWQLGGGMVSLRTIIEGTVTAAIVMMFALWVSAAIEKKIIKGSGNDLSVRKMVANVVRALLLFLGLLFAMSAVGINLTALSVLEAANTGVKRLDEDPSRGTYSPPPFPSLPFRAARARPPRPCRTRPPGRAGRGACRSGA